MSTEILFIVAVFLGVIIGWIWRSIQFAADKDCANPEHEGK